MRIDTTALIAEGERMLATVRNLTLGKETRERALARVRSVEAVTGRRLIGNYNGG